eukprot:scaffold125_cov210-Chaetoceros_neogracile.AAC.3
MDHSQQATPRWKTPDVLTNTWTRSELEDSVRIHGEISHSKLYIPQARMRGAIRRGESMRATEMKPL